MAVPIKIPDVGTTVEEFGLYSWLVDEGDSIALGDPVAEIETDKAIVDLESPVVGVLLKKMVEEGAEVALGDVLAWVGEPGETVPDEPDDTASGEHAEAGEAEPADRQPAPAAVAEAREREPARVAPIVRNLAEKLGVDLAAVAGTGAGGTVTREDVTRASREQGSRSAAAADVAQQRTSPPDRELLLSLYRTMVLIRQFEERVKYLFLEGIMPGTIHQYQGQEAIATGVCAALGPDDVITSTHRPHGHAIAKGLTVRTLMHELFGKATGCCRGKGGSMHIGDLDKGMVPAIAIVGGGVPVATGIALAFKMKKEPRVAVCFMGDGAVNEGAFHEGVNMGAIWSLPVVYVIENNRYSASTPISQTTRVEKLSDRAAAYGIPGVTIDGNDVLAVFETAWEAVARARAGEGPTLVEAMTYRITGHSRRDPCHYQPEEERAEALRHEPIAPFAAHLLSEGHADQDALDQIGRQIDAEIESAVESAMAAPDPAPEDALAGLFVTDN